MSCVSGGCLHHMNEVKLHSELVARFSEKIRHVQ